MVTAAIEGIKDAVQNEKNGFLLPSESPEIWAKKMESILVDEASLAQFSEAACAYTLQQFSWHKMATEYGKIFGLFGKNPNNFYLLNQTIIFQLLKRLIPMRNN